MMCVSNPPLLCGCWDVGRAMGTALWLFIDTGDWNDPFSEARRMFRFTVRQVEDKKAGSGRCRTPAEMRMESLPNGDRKEALNSRVRMSGEYKTGNN